MVYPSYLCPFFKERLIDILALNNSSKSILQFRKHSLGKLRTVNHRSINCWNISISNSIGWDDDLETLLGGLSRRGGNADVCHISNQYDLVLSLLLDFYLQSCAGEGAGVVLVNQGLARLRSELSKFFGQCGLWGEDWSAFWSVVNNVDYAAVGCAVLLQKRRDGLSGGSDVLGLQLAVDVPGCDC